MTERLYVRLQEALEALYRINGAPPAAQFRLSRDHLDALGSVSVGREALVIHQAPDSEYTDVGIYVCEHVLDRAQSFLDAREATLAHATHIDEFCVALEGVSHFVYFTYCGVAHERPVSRIELELQAEVDKYLLLRLHYPMPDLVERLFDAIAFDERLDLEELQRYRIANRRARRYALWIERKIQAGEVDHVLKDARRLYRMPLPDKLAHIARAA